MKLNNETYNFKIFNLLKKKIKLIKRLKAKVINFNNLEAIFKLITLKHLTLTNHHFSPFDLI